MSQRRTAFTLVELLVVIGIMAVLISLLVPVIGAARRYANTVVCTSNLRQITTACLTHSQEHQGFMPLAGEIVVSGEPGRGVPAALGDVPRTKYTYAIAASEYNRPYVVVPITAALAPYMGWEELQWDDWTLVDQALNEGGIRKRYTCPATNLDQSAGSNGAPEGQGMVMSLMDVGGDLGMHMMWSTNSDYGFNEGVFGYHYDPRNSTRRLRGNVSGLRNSSQLVLLTDAQRRSDRVWGFDPSLCWTPTLDSDEPASLGDAWDSNGKVLDNSMFDTKRHRGSINVAFADGHVATLSLGPELHSAYLLPR